MKKTITIIFALIFSVSFSVAQTQNVQQPQQVERSYQDAFDSARKCFSQRQYAEAKRYYLIARDLKPENAAVIDQIIAQIDRLLAVGADSGRQIGVDTGSASTSTSDYQGTVVPGATLAEKFNWLDRLAESHNTYIVEVNADESIVPRTLSYKGGIDITIVLRGDNQNRTLRLSSHGTMFTVKTDVTFILDGNITLQGHKGNSGSMVYVNGGTLKMNAGTTITGNICDGYQICGGVYVAYGTFEMTGGSIINNTHIGAVRHGVSAGGVVVGNFAGHAPATFTMSGGIISNNKDKWGGGIYVAGIFNMKGGEISGNMADQGGGVYVCGGGNFNMNGGIISSNIAYEYGGGIFCEGNFTKTGGTITGYSSSQSNGNVVKDDSGILARRGHTAYYDPNKYIANNKRRKETTAGPGANLSSGSDKNWDQ